MCIFQAALCLLSLVIEDWSAVDWVVVQSGHAACTILNELGPSESQDRMQFKRWYFVSIQD
eukprot:157118-Amphidinium_carterae.1